jgi:glycosyltransferase involved in cell wall biosynthesis
MASGLPVVGLQAEGVRDLVKDGETGYLLHCEEMPQESQVTGYRDLLTRLVEQSSLRQRMSQVARASASLRSWDEAMKCLMLGYQEVLQQEHPLVAA